MRWQTRAGLDPGGCDRHRRRDLTLTPLPFPVERECVGLNMPSTGRRGRMSASLSNRMLEPYLELERLTGGRRSRRPALPRVGAHAPSRHEVISQFSCSMVRSRWLRSPCPSAGCGRRFVLSCCCSQESSSSRHQVATGAPGGGLRSRRRARRTCRCQAVYRRRPGTYRHRCSLPVVRGGRGSWCRRSHRHRDGRWRWRRLGYRHVCAAAAGAVTVTVGAGLGV